MFLFLLKHNKKNPHKWIKGLNRKIKEISENSLLNLVD